MDQNRESPGGTGRVDRSDTAKIKILFKQIQEGVKTAAARN